MTSKNCNELYSNIVVIKQLSNKNIESVTRIHQLSVAESKTVTITKILQMRQTFGEQK